MSRLSFLDMSRTLTSCLARFFFHELFDNFVDSFHQAQRHSEQSA